jgi:hypothetical protein
MVMVVQQVSKMFPLLVGVALVSAVAGAVLAQQYTACTASAPGGANRTFDCMKWSGCRPGPQGMCKTNGSWITPMSGSDPHELWYEYCKSYPQRANCVWDDTYSVCLTYLGWVDKPDCTGQSTCTGMVFRQDCHTEF